MTRFAPAFALAALGAILLAAGCGADAPAPDADPRPTVFVSILPMKTFVEKVAGGRVRAQVLVPPDRSPATWQPTARQMTELGSAAAWLRIGVPFEAALLPRVRSAYPDLRIVDVTRGIALAPIDAPDPDEAGVHEGHGHAPHGDEEAAHNHAGMPDPHVWLDPVLAKAVAGNIAEALAAIDPAGAEAYAKNLAAFRAELDAVNEKLARALAPLKGRRLYVYHPAYGYFARRYGLVQTPVEVGGRQPSARQVIELIDRAKADGVRVIFVQPQFPVRAAETVAEAIGGAVVRLDPMAPDYIANLERMADEVQAALAPKGAP